MSEEFAIIIEETNTVPALIIGDSRRYRDVRNRLSILVRQGYRNFQVTVVWQEKETPKEQLAIEQRVRSALATWSKRNNIPTRISKVSASVNSITFVLQLKGGPDNLQSPNRDPQTLSGLLGPGRYSRARPIQIDVQGITYEQAVELLPEPRKAMEEHVKESYEPVYDAIMEKADQGGGWKILRIRAVDDKSLQNKIRRLFKAIAKWSKEDHPDLFLSIEPSNGVKTITDDDDKVFLEQVIYVYSSHQEPQEAAIPDERNSENQ